MAVPFEHRETLPRDFYVNGETPQKVPMMSQMDEFGHAAADGVQILQLPYEGDELSMLVVLPNERDGLRSVELARRRQLLVFDRFLARIVTVLGDAAMLKGGLVLELRLSRVRSDCERF